jgi:hypothetical protein
MMLYAGLQTPLAQIGICYGQSYPQEEDKTDDMVILKTDARGRRQGLQVQARWDKPMTMTPATVPSTVPG